MKYDIDCEITIGVPMTIDAPDEDEAKLLAEEFLTFKYGTGCGLSINYISVKEAKE